MPERAQKLALAVGETMYGRDNAAQMLGIKLEEIRPGFARMTMLVRPDMVNGHDICHGGLTFTLADTAFAYACNSHNNNTVAAGCDIVFPNAGRKGDVLTAVAEERFLRGRSGVYDVTVTNQKGDVIGLFRGQSRRIDGHVVDLEKENV